MNSTRPSNPRLVRLGRAVACFSLVLLLGAAFAFALAFHRYSRVLDRRLAHSALYATRPRLRVVSHTTLLGRSAAQRGLGPGRPGRAVPAFNALPPELVSAVLAIEDRSFFTHSGVDYLRTGRCAVQDALTLHLTCGGSTITQQLARTDFLTQNKTLSRKLAEILIARRLEDRLTKQQIFAMYARDINLGQQGPAPIKGFGQAAHAYFGKDLGQLDLSQYALLAGMIHAPNFDNPYRHPERATARRNVVLNAMVDTGAITREEAAAAKAEPLDLAQIDSPVFLRFEFSPPS